MRFLSCSSTSSAFLVIALLSLRLHCLALLSIATLFRISFFQVSAVHFLIQHRDSIPGQLHSSPCKSIPCLRVSRVHSSDALQRTSYPRLCYSISTSPYPDTSDLILRVSNPSYRRISFSAPVSQLYCVSHRLRANLLRFSSSFLSSVAHSCPCHAFPCPLSFERVSSTPVHFKPLPNKSLRCISLSFHVVPGWSTQFPIASCSCSALPDPVSSSPHLRVFVHCDSGSFHHSSMLFCIAYHPVLATPLRISGPLLPIISSRNVSIPVSRHLDSKRILRVG